MLGSHVENRVFIMVLRHCMHVCRHLGGVWPTTPSLTFWTLTSAFIWRGGQAPCRGSSREVQPALLSAIEYTHGCLVLSCVNLHSGMSPTEA